MTTSTKPSPLAALFNIPTPRTQLDRLEAAEEEPELTPEIRSATCTAITTSTPDPERPDEFKVLLRVGCPYCGHTHIHPGGTAQRPLRGTRRARCTGHPTRHLHYKLEGGDE